MVKFESGQKEISAGGQTKMFSVNTLLDLHNPTFLKSSLHCLDQYLSIISDVSSQVEAGVFL